jgi:hypothetical protein
MFTGTAYILPSKLSASVTWLGNVAPAGGVGEHRRFDLLSVSSTR